MKKENFKNNPHVSVVIPVFNGAQFLEEAVTSVLKSTFTNFEILLIDDGSNDHSKKICEHLVLRHSKKIRFLSIKNNRGLGRVLNLALREARGQYIARLNQDDIMLPHRLQVEVNYLSRHPEVVAVGSWNRLFDDKGTTHILKFLPTDEEIKKVWMLVSPFSDPTTMYRKSVALRAGGYIQKFWPADDTQLWYRMGKLGKLANIQRPLVHVRWHKGAGSVKFFRRMAHVTYRMHRWAHTTVQNAPWYIQIFWIIQYIAGLVLSPQWNWSIYWKMKSIIAFYETAWLRLKKIKRDVAKVIHVINQPIKAYLSGAYTK
ncbi:glycosyltransferase [Candidatus Gottesmanbacteria bacterium]|nr:glycosyltransferase [Candidatus Gottesmanbacteria bacterium]